MYLFLAIPNFCGSTLIHEVLATSDSVAVLTSDCTLNAGWNLVEGTSVSANGYSNLLGPLSIEANMEHIYANPNNYNWAMIEAEWNDNWSRGYPSAVVKMQKSPSDIFRVKMITEAFDDLKWVLMVRNPYNHVEEIVRKALFGIDPLRQLDQVCFHALRSLEVQIENIALLGENAYVMTYEDFCSRPDFHRRGILKFMPELGDFSVTAKMHIKSENGVGIHDSSVERLEKFFSDLPNIKDEINKYFIPCRHVIEAWGYEIL